MASTEQQLVNSLRTRTSELLRLANAAPRRRLVGPTQALSDAIALATGTPGDVRSPRGLDIASAPATAAFLEAQAAVRSVASHPHPSGIGSRRWLPRAFPAVHHSPNTLAPQVSQARVFLLPTPPAVGGGGCCAVLCESSPPQPADLATIEVRLAESANRVLALLARGDADPAASSPRARSPVGRWAASKVVRGGFV